MALALMQSMFCRWAPCCGHWGHWVSVTKGMSRWWENACLLRPCQGSYWPPRWTSLCFIYRGVLPQMRIFRSFRWQGSVAVSSSNNFWDVKQICGCIQQVASTAHRIMAGQRCFCQGKRPLLLSMCVCVHEQNIQINGNCCQSFVSLESAGAPVLFWVLLIMHGLLPHSI